MTGTYKHANIDYMDGAMEARRRGIFFDWKDAMYNIGTFPPIRVQDQILEACGDHSDKRSSQLLVQYSDSGQNNTQTKYSQTMVGKIGEFIVHRSLSSVFNISLPDLGVVPLSLKNYGSDIIGEGFELAVKTCEKSSFEPSWTFQHSRSKGGRVDDEIFKDNPKKNLLAAFVVVDMREKEGRLLSVNQVVLLKSIAVFRSPRKKSLRGEKDIIYLSTLIGAGIIGGMEEIRRVQSNYSV